MMTLDLSNLVILFDGVKNNHEIEIVAASNRRIDKVLRVNPEYVYFLKRSSRFLKGKYIFDETSASSLCVAVIGYGDFSGGVNSLTVERVQVSTLIVKGKQLDRYQATRFAIDYFRENNSLNQDFCVLEIYIQDDLIEKAAGFRKSTLWELVCLKMSQVYRKCKSLYYGYTPKMRLFPSGK